MDCLNLRLGDTEDAKYIEFASLSNKKKLFDIKSQGRRSTLSSHKMQIYILYMILFHISCNTM